MERPIQPTTMDLPDEIQVVLDILEDRDYNVPTDLMDDAHMVLLLLTLCGSSAMSTVL